MFATISNRKALSSHFLKMREERRKVGGERERERKENKGEGIVLGIITRDEFLDEVDVLCLDIHTIVIDEMAEELI